MTDLDVATSARVSRIQALTVGKDVHPDVAPAKDDRLRHPVTGEDFGQRSLIKFINEAPYNGRNLITRNGRVVPRLRQLFEQTIRGELG